MKKMEKVFEQIGKEITKTKKSVTARDIVNRTEELLKENGVVVNVTTCTFDDVTEMSIGLDFTEHDKVFEDTILELGRTVGVLEGAIDTLRSRCTESARELFDRNCYGGLTIVCHSKEIEFENKQLKQRIAELESRETETCENEPKISDSAPSREWYDNRHQSDCIEIDRLNTTIDVLIHKVEYLRQFAGLE